MKKIILSLLILSPSFSALIAQSTSCNLAAIDAAMAAGGYQFLNVGGQPCSRYYFNNNATANWNTAQSQATAVGGHLVTVNNAAENAALLSAAQSAGLTGAIWIGFTDAASEGNWTWVDGTPTSYSNWNGGEPSNSGGFPCYTDEDGAIMQLSNGFWNDLALNNGCPGAAQFSSVIEIDLCPQVNVNGNGISVCAGAQTQLTSSASLGSPPYTFNWFQNPNPVAIGTGSPFTISPSAGVTYAVEVEDRYGCSDSVQFIVNVTTCSGPVGCDLNLIRNTMTAAGYIELLGVNNPCSMYFIDPVDKSSQAAETQAQIYGGHMVSVESATENAQLIAALNAAGYGGAVWIGVSDIQNEGNFVNLDQSPLVYTNWAPNEPNNQIPNCCNIPLFGCQGSYQCNNGEDCVQIYANGTWNDLPCQGSNAKSVIEINLCPDPTIALPPVPICEGGSGVVSATAILGSQPYVFNWGNVTAATSLGIGATISINNVSPNTQIAVAAVDRYGCIGTDTAIVPTQFCATPPGCNIQAIRAAYTAAGYVELSGINNPCSMYFVNPTSQSAILSEQQAQTLGAHMISIQSPSENQQLLSALIAAGFNIGLNPGQTAVWLGISDQATEGSFVWLDQSPVTYSNWAPAEPNNFIPGCCSNSCPGSLNCSDGEDCVQIYPDGTWNDLPCDNNSISVIEVNLCPEIQSSSNDTAICQGQTVSITASAILGSTPYTFTWNPGNQIANPFSASPNTTTDYIVSIADRWGCFVNDTTTVTVQPMPAQSFTLNPSPACEGANVTLNYTGNSSATATYTWNFNGANVISGAAAGPYTLSWSASGNQTVTLDVVEGLCTAPQTSQNITINPNPTADAGPDTTICSGGSVLLGTPAVAGYTYSWNPVINLINSSSANPTFSFLNTASTAQLFNFSMTANLNGCSDTDQVTVTVNPPASIVIIGDAPLNFCDGLSVNLSTANSYSTYLWSNSSNSTTINITQSGTYSLTTTDAQNCYYTSNNLNVVVYPNPSVSLLNLEDQTCYQIPDGSITVTGTGGTPGYNYSWNTTPVQNTASIANLDPGSYSVTVTDLNSCSADASYTIQPAPFFGIDLSDYKNPTCFNYSDGYINAAVTGGTPPLTYQWAPVNGNMPSLLNLADSTYFLTVTDFNNCTVSDSVELVEPEEIIATVQSPLTLVFPEIYQMDIEVTPINNSYQYQWNNTLGFSCFNCQDPTITTYYTTEYSLTVTNSDGCADTIRFILDVDNSKTVYMPNIFTPNGDNINDEWCVYSFGVKEFTFKIFNRWGEKVYEGTSDKACWNGRDYRGKDALQGVYTYIGNIAYLDGTYEKFQGSITLIR